MAMSEARLADRLVATIVFPVPPLPLATAIFILQSTLLYFVQATRLKSLNDFLYRGLVRVKGIHFYATSGQCLMSVRTEMTADNCTNAFINSELGSSDPRAASLCNRLIFKRFPGSIVCIVLDEPGGTTKTWINLAFDGVITSMKPVSCKFLLVFFSNYSSVLIMTHY